MKPANKGRDESPEAELWILTCSCRVGSEGGPVTVTEVGEFVLGTVEWNDDGDPCPCLASEAELLQTKTRTN